jgi:hypothetical protein
VPSDDRAAVEAALLRLARAVQRFNAYPQGSPLSAQALRAAHRAVGSLGRDSLVLRVTQRTLLLDDAPVSALPAVSDLAARLHHASVGTVEIARSASERDVTVFCRELVRRDDDECASLPDRLREYGVEKIAVTLFERPAVLEVPIVLPPAAEAAPRGGGAQGERGGYLYPAGKGWVRVDPVNAAVSHLTLTDLAQLVADPFALASMLVALSDDPPPRDAADALARKFEDVVSLFRASDPRTAERLLAGLARAVLALEPERRLSLLRECILPGLIEGRFDGSVLRHLPDLELADTLSLLFEMKVAAPELVVLALDRLDLPDERRHRIEPMLEARAAEVDEPQAAGAIDGYSDGRIRVDLSRSKGFRDFASFDLAVNEETELAWSAARDAVTETDAPAERIDCQLRLLALNPNPDVSAWLLASVQAALLDLRQGGSWPSVARVLGRLRAVEEALPADRNETRALIDATLCAVADTAYVAAVARLVEGDPADQTASRLIAAAGRAIVPALLETLDQGGPRSRTGALVRVLSAHAAGLTAALGEHLGHENAGVVRDLVSIIGHGGPGAEPLLVPVLSHADEAVVREAYRALVRIGTSAAHLIVIDQLRTFRRSARLAEDAFWRFPPDLAGRHALELLGDERFVTRYPRVARQLLARTAGHQLAGFRPILRRLARLRWHLWRPAHVRVGLAAARLEASGR